MFEELHSEFVQPEFISKLFFVDDEVLQKKEAVQKRFDQLVLSMHRSITGYEPTELVVETYEGIRKIQSQIWAITTKHVVLSGGNTVPIHCIRQVRKVTK